MDWLLPGLSWESRCYGENDSRRQSRNRRSTRKDRAEASWRVDLVCVRFWRRAMPPPFMILRGLNGGFVAIPCVGSPLCQFWDRGVQRCPRPDGQNSAMLQLTRPLGWFHLTVTKDFARAHWRLEKAWAEAGPEWDESCRG